MRFTINRATWRCGHNSDNPKNKHGWGLTHLCNTAGFMCCLGQIAEQLGLPQKSMIQIAEPCDTRRVMAPLTQKDAWDDLDNTILSICAMRINDDTTTTLQEKEAALIKLFLSEGHELTFTGEYIETPSESEEGLGERS